MCIYREYISFNNSGFVADSYSYNVARVTLDNVSNVSIQIFSQASLVGHPNTHTHTNYVGQPTKFKSNVSAFSLVFSGDKSCQDLRHQTFLSDRFPSATKRLKVVRICIGLRLLVKASARGNLANNVGSFSCSGVQSRIVQQMKH